MTPADAEEITLKHDLISRDTALVGTQVSLWNDLLHPEGKSETTRYLHFMLEPSYTLYEQIEFGFPNQQNFPPAYPSANSPLTTQIPYGSWFSLNKFAVSFDQGLDIVYSGSNFDMGMTPGGLTPPSDPGNPFITVGGESYVDSVSRWIAAYESGLAPTVDRRYWIHENRAGLDRSYGSFPSVDNASYRAFILTSSREWYEELLAKSRDANPDITIDLLPTGSAWASVWENILPSMEFEDWFRDSDHGHAWTHAVYAAAVYSKMFGAKAPDISAQLAADGAPSDLTDNWEAITTHVAEFVSE